MPVIRLAAPLLALLLIQCGGRQSNDPLAAGGASPIGSAGHAGAWMGHVIEPGAGGDLPPSSCNGLDAFSESVTSTMFAADPPRPQGGSIANGVYHLTRIEDFVGASGSTNEPRRQKLGRLYISASTDSTADLQLAWLDNFGELPLPIEQNLSLVITGTSYAYTVTCSTARGLEAPGSTSFTASTNELILIFPGPGGVTRVETFARE